jgi:hypothetical protein
MKKLHLAVSKDDLRPALMNIQVKNGFVYATDCHILVKFPIDEVFGMGSGITKNDHFYIDGKQWGKFKFHTAYMFIYENGILTAKDKKYNEIAMIKIKNENEINGKYPDCDAVIYSDEKPKEKIDSISFNHELYHNLVEVFNFAVPLFRMAFFSDTSQIWVYPHDATLSNGRALIMPIKFN